MKNLKKPFIIVLVVILSLMCACSVQKDVAEEKKVETADRVVTSSGSTINNTKVVFEVENYGNMVVETYPQYAPETVAQFIALVRMGYYDGMAIDKINPGFSMEISDKTALSSGEYTDSINGEFAKNGYSNDLPLSKGTLAMCYLPGEYNSATSKFMIILNDDLGIDGNYAGFAKVVDGTSVFEQISKIAPDADGSPVSPIVMKKVYVVD